jgi:hypothetical protein
LQILDSICVRGPAVVIPAPTELNVTVGNCDCATKLYQTSTALALPQAAAGKEPAAVAFPPRKVPAVGAVQVIPEVKGKAVAQVACENTLCLETDMHNKKKRKLL